MIVCAFYTDDAYWRSAQRMRASAEEHGLTVDIHRIVDQGSWEKNVAMKPAFAAQMLGAHPGQDILLVDTDAVFRRSPDALLKPEFPEPVALFFAGNGRPSSGTIFLRSTKSAMTFLKIWDKLIRETPDQPGRPAEFEALVRITTKPRVVSIKHLGPEYFWVDRIMRQQYPGAEPVIEHFMVSKE